MKEQRNDLVAWVGERATDDDPDFEEFSTVEDGVRAGFVTLLNYNKLYGLATIDAIINRFAPASENNLEAYANHISMYCGVNRNVPLDFKNSQLVMKLGKGIIRHENGSQPYDDLTIWRALRKAYVHVFNVDIGSLA